VKKIALITTGGTIGSSVVDKKVTLSDSYEDMFSGFRTLSNTEVDVIPALNKSSEDIVPEDWLEILNAILSANDDESYSGIVVTHGTDTLVYTVAAILSYEPTFKKPVCITGSFYAPDHPKSDAAINLQAALNAVERDFLQGVYVAFRSNIDNSRVNIAHASTLLPMSFNDRYFQYIYNSTVGSFTKEKQFNVINKHERSSCAKSPSFLNSRLPKRSLILEAQRNIAMVKLYPGIDLPTLEALAANKKILVVELYHSGTGPSYNRDSIVQFIQSHPSVKVLMGAFPSSYIQFPYTSSLKLIDSGAYLYRDLQAPYLYTFSLLALALEKPSDQIVDLLTAWQLKHE